MTKYISTNDTAKLVRKALKEAFPEIKFSVRGSKYAGGSSINVSWIEGSIDSQVDSIIKCFAGSAFDSMQDMKSYKSTVMNGEEVHFGADYVVTRRDVSDDRVTQLTALVEKAGRDYWLTIAVEMNHPSPCAAVQYPYLSAKEFAHNLLRNCPVETFVNRNSATIDSVEV